MTEPTVAQVAEGDSVRVTIERVAAGGDAIARLPSGRTLFLDRGLPGDVVDATIERVQKRFARARVVTIAAASVARVPSACAVAERCGGCRFWGASYADELAWKSAAAEANVRRLARDVVFPALEVVGADAMTGYRERARLRLGEDGGSGFLAAGSHAVVSSSTCPILHPGLDAARALLTPVVRDLDGVVAMFVEWDRARDAAAVTFEMRRETFTDALRTLRPRVERLKPLYGVSTIVATAGRRPVLLVGDGRVVRERLCGSERAVVREPTGEFSQANGSMNAVLAARVVAAVRAGVPAGEPRRVLELFAGSGNLTFPLLGAGCDVVAVEGASRPVAAAAKAWSGIRPRLGRSASFSVADLSHPLRGDALVGLGRAQVVVTDPPRGGMSAALVEQLAGCEAQRLVYVSCDPPAMARDVARLSRSGWQVSAWSALDLFARTPHLEFVVRLDRPRTGALPLAGSLG